MNTREQEHDLHLTEKIENDGIVVWDKKGLVVRWPDGHHSRFSWSALRQACLCDECHTASREQATPTRADSAEGHRPSTGSEKRSAQRGGQWLRGDLVPAAGDRPHGF